MTQHRPTASVREAKAVAHPLRLRILRLCRHQAMTNKELSDRLGRDPGTVLYHVRQLLAVGFLEAAPVRAGSSGALEKPYRATGRTWWMDTALTSTIPGGALAPIEAFQDELAEAGPASIDKMSRFVLRLSAEDAEDLGGRILKILDEYVESDDARDGLPVYGGIFVLHRLAD
jgi:DNA-binding transcriptional ArsR family regulator